MTDTPLTPDVRLALAERLEKEAEYWESDGGKFSEPRDRRLGKLLREAAKALRSAPAEPPQCTLEDDCFCPACLRERAATSQPEPPATPAGTLDDLENLLSKKGSQVVREAASRRSAPQRRGVGSDDLCPDCLAEMGPTVLGGGPKHEGPHPADAPLIVWMTTDDPVKRDAAYLRMCAEHVRNGTDLTWDIPNTRAATLGDIANRLEQRAQPAPPTGWQATSDDPIVMTARTVKALMIDRLQRAIRATRELPGTLPLTAEECVTILEAEDFMGPLSPAPPSPTPPKE